MTAGRGQRELTRIESLELLATALIGRVISTAHALPTALPVHFALDEGCIVFRSGEGMKLAAAQSGTVVAFQTDHFDGKLETGWSVLVTGLARLISDPHELRLADELAIPGWIGRSTDGPYARIEPGLVTGWRFAPL